MTDIDESLDITDSSSIGDDDLSEVIKLREELPFTQLEPYDSNITHVILTKGLDKQIKNKSRYPTFTLHKKEIHNESIGDEYDEYFSIQDLIKENATYTNVKVLDTKHTNVLLQNIDEKLPTLKKFITPNMTDLNVSKIIKMDIHKLTYILSFLYFGVYLNDPNFYDLPYLNLEVLIDNDNKVKDHIQFLLKYFKFRIKSLNEEYSQDNTIEVDGEDIDIEVYSKKILTLLLMLKNNLQR